MQSHLQQTLAASRRQLLADCQAQSKILAFAVNTLVEALPDDEQSRLLCEAFTDAAMGSIDNLQTGIAIAIDLTGTIQRLDHKPAAIAPGDLLKASIGAELALAMGAMLASEKPDENQARQLDQKLEQLHDTANQVAQQVTAAAAGQREAIEGIGYLRELLNQIEQAAGMDTDADNPHLQTIENYARALPDSLQAGIDQVQQGLTAWRDAQRQLQSPLN